jgi:NDP-sugar pyrophosphorylase family protein
MAVPLASLTSPNLWPSMVKRNEYSGYIPKLPEQDEPVWLILDPSHEDSLDNDDSKGPICIDDRASIGECVRIEGPCYIGPNAEVRHGAYIRPNTWLCCDSVVGHASEVKHSLLLPGAKAPHFNYVGDSILGKDVNLGAGCKLSNLRNDGRSVLVRGLEEGIVDSGLRKFGAILGDGVAIGCNVVTNPGVIIGTNANIWPNLNISGVFGANSTIEE